MGNSPGGHEGSVARTTLDLLASHGERRGCAPAILAPGRAALSYGALRAEVDRAGASLAAMGLGRGSRIALALPDGPDAAVALLAAMTWASCAPLDPHLDRDACTELLRSLRVDCLIALEGDESPAAQAAGALGLLRVRLSSRPSDPAGVFALHAEAARAPVMPMPPAPGDVALIMHTSGTTGRHKIVPLTQAQLMWSACGQPIDSDDRCLAVSPLFTRSGLGISLLWPLAAGASTVITGGFDAAGFVGWLEEFEPTFYTASPTIHASILDALAGRAPSLPLSLRFVRSSSSALPAAIRERLAAALGVPVIEGYGSTEAGTIAQNPLPPGEQRGGSVGIARNIEIMILGDDGVRMPPGATGEILVRGPGVIRGYENDAQADRLSFHDGWWRTGDLGHFDADGYLFITGRVNELINRGGRKFSPSEIDDLFMRHPSVREAAAFGVSHPSLGMDVAAAIVLREQAPVTAKQLRDYALDHLAAYKVPSMIVLVDELPRNALGKLVRRTLAEALAGALRADFVAPRDRDENLVADVFAAVLDLPCVGAGDNFFGIGGDSLRATQVLSLLNAREGVELPRLSVFEAPTVAELAQRLATARRAAEHAGTGTAPPLRRARRGAGAAVGGARRLARQGNAKR